MSSTNSSQIQPVEFEDISSKYDLTFRILAAAVFIFYAVVAASLYTGYVTYLQQKPLGLQTILDLVHRDLAFCYAIICVYLPILFTIKLIFPYPIPHDIALPMSILAQASYYCLSIFLTVASIMRYIHIYHPWKLESFGKSDEFISGCVYYTTTLVCLIMSAYLTSVGSNQ